MKKVNLRDLYPDVYKNDHFVEVTEDVLETIQSAERAEAAYDRRMYRYKAYYSLDCDNGIENAILMKPQTPEMLLEEKQLREQLYAAVMALPEKQAKRIYKLMLQVSIYMQQQKAELAALELEKALFKEITRVQMLLTKLIDAELASGNTESACKIAEKSSSMVDVFDMWEYNRYIASYQILEQKQNADATLHLLEQMLEALTTHWSLTDSVLYHRMAPETKAIQSHELIPVLLNGLETDPQCAYLREHPKFREIIDKYKNK